MDNPFYPYSALVQRPPLALPDGARVAVWIGVNVEHYAFGRPALSLAPFTAELVPDPLNHGWRDYGLRIGLWRLVEAVEQAGFPTTAIANMEVLRRYPAVVEEGLRGGWAWVAHGVDNSTWHVGMEREEELELIGGIADEFERTVGARPRGWLGPVLTSTMSTPAVLAELGFDYTLDWAVDDQPFDLEVPSGRLLSVPYSSEVNDIPILAIRGQSGAELRDAIVDLFDQLYGEGERTARVMGIGLHPFLAGQPHRARYVAEALEHIAGHDHVWRTTSDEVARWYLASASRDRLHHTPGASRL